MTENLPHLTFRFSPCRVAPPPRTPIRRCGAATGAQHLPHLAAPHLCKCGNTAANGNWLRAQSVRRIFNVALSVVPSNLAVLSPGVSRFGPRCFVASKAPHGARAITLRTRLGR